MKDTTEQCVLFEELHDRAVHVQFDQPDSSVDGGALLLKAADEFSRLDREGNNVPCLPIFQEAPEIYLQYNFVRQSLCLYPVHNTLSTLAHSKFLSEIQ